MDNKTLVEDLEINDGNREDYHNKVDILFVIDTTSSMGVYFQEAKKTILDISQMFTKQEYDIQFAVCEYRDHPPQENTFVYQHYDLSGSEKMADVVQSLQAVGGGDDPEAVMDGLYYGLKLTSWRSDKHDNNFTLSKRFIFHICDAPPHGSQYGGHSSNKQWEQNGCTCEISLDMVKQLMEEYKVIYNLVECANLDQMITVFKASFGEIFQEAIQIEKHYVCKMKYASKPAKFKSRSHRFDPSQIKKKYISKDKQVDSSEKKEKIESKVSASENIFSQQIQQNLLKNLK